MFLIVVIVFSFLVLSTINEPNLHLSFQIFGGIVNAGNPDLEATDLAANEYPLFIFKTIYF